MENRERFSDIRVSMTLAVKKSIKDRYKSGADCEMAQTKIIFFLDKEPRNYNKISLL